MKNTFRNYQRIFPYVKPYWWRALLAILLTLPVGSMDALIAWMMKPFMDTVMVEKRADSMTFFPVFIILITLSQGLMGYAATYLNAWVGGRITADLKSKIYKKMIRYETSFFDQTSSGDVQLRFNSDVDLACSGLLANVKTVTTRTFSIISLVAVLFINSWQLSIIALSVMVFALRPLSQVRKKISGLANKSVVSGGTILTHYNEAFAGNRVISSYNLHKVMSEKFDKSLHVVFRLGMKLTQRTGIVSPMMHFITSLGIAGVVYAGGYYITSHTITSGNFVSFITALLMLYQPMKSMGNNFVALQTSLMAMERVFSLLDYEPAIKNKENTVVLETVTKGIAYRDISFEYKEGRPVLQDITIDIPVGQTLALVGNSGGGKTTLVNLLPRFYEVTKGQILIDDVDVRDYDLDSLREKIAVVFQDNFLFAGTIRENILLGHQGVTDMQIENAIENACLSDFIQSLPEGLDTYIGERGVMLSGGQKQRVAIARAFIKNAPIVILDEATSALDNKSEAVVQQAIYNLMKDRTVVIIAHRLTTVQNADRIVVINHGTMVESGTHEELIQLPESAYASLYRTQLKL